MAFIMEADQYNKWIYAAQGQLGHTLNADDNNPVWTEDPSDLPCATLPSAHSPFAAWAPSVRRQQTPSPTLC